MPRTGRIKKASVEVNKAALTALTDALIDYAVRVWLLESNGRWGTPRNEDPCIPVEVNGRKHDCNIVATETEHGWPVTVVLDCCEVSESDDPAMGYVCLRRTLTRSDYDGSYSAGPFEPLQLWLPMTTHALPPSEVLRAFATAA